MVQWQYELGFLSNTLIALLYSCSMGFRFVAQANDQFVKQYSMWDRIIQWRYDFAALTVKKGLICLKCCKLNLMVLDTFLICFLKVKFESSMTPRYLKWGTSYISAPFKNTLDPSILTGRLLNIMHTVFFAFNFKQMLFSQC